MKRVAASYRIITLIASNQYQGKQARAGSSPVVSRSSYELGRRLISELSSEFHFSSGLICYNHGNTFRTLKSIFILLSSYFSIYSPQDLYSMLHVSALRIVYSVSSYLDYSLTMKSLSLTRMFNQNLGFRVLWICGVCLVYQ